jgi:hypothetical protein
MAVAGTRFIRTAKAYFCDGVDEGLVCASDRFRPSLGAVRPTDDPFLIRLEPLRWPFKSFILA